MKKALFSLLLFCTIQPGFSTTYTAIASGNYEDAATWSPAGGPPSTGDNVIIPAGYVVTVTTNNITVLSGLIVSGTLKFTVGAKLNFNAAATVQVNNGGAINGGNGGSQIVFPARTYAGPFTITGPYYLTNTASGSGTLAVSLLYFKNELAGSGIKILWEAATETNIDHYELQWGNTTSNWATIFTQKINTPGGSTAYSYLHNSGLSDKNYYRLKTVEKNGSFSYSEIIAATKNNTTDFKLVPAANTITCLIGSSKLSSIKVTDLSGKTVSAINNLATTQYTLAIGNLPKGIYFVTLFQNNTSSTARFFKQ